MCRTYSFYELVLEELDVAKEDRRGYPEDCYSIWFKYLRTKHHDKTQVIQMEVAT